MTGAFDKMMAGLEDAIAYVEGDAEAGRVASVVDVRAVRVAAKMTQVDFARRYRLSVGALRDWEQRRRRPDTGSRTLLKMIEADPRGVEAILAKVR